MGSLGSRGFSAENVLFLKDSLGIVETPSFVLKPCVAFEVENCLTHCTFLFAQNKDLKSRIAHFETSHRSNKEGLVAQMEVRIVELEERLENEER